MKNNVIEFECISKMDNDVKLAGYVYADDLDDDVTDIYFYDDCGLEAGNYVPKPHCQEGSSEFEAYYDGIADRVYSTFDKDGIKVETLLDFIIRTYEVNLSAFEVKPKTLNIRVSPSDLEALDKVEGKNRADKFRNLLSFYFDNKEE